MHSVFAVQQGSVQYGVPVDYSVMNEQELNSEAEALFNAYMQTDDENRKQILLYKMLSNYQILGKIDKENPLYFARLGVIYDELGKDRWAKSNFFRSTNLSNEYPYSFYVFGNFYFKRKDFKKALKAYMKAYKEGYNTDYDTLYQIGIIYEKYGDYKSSVKYFKQALLYKDTPELRERIRLLDELYENNSLYDLQRKKGQEE